LIRIRFFHMNQHRKPANHLMRNEIRSQCIRDFVQNSDQLE